MLTDLDDDPTTITFEVDKFSTFALSTSNTDLIGEYTVFWGDANGDSTIDGKDILYIRKYLANFNYDTGVSNVEIGAGADANGDGNIDGKDILIIRKYLANYNFDTGESSVVLGPSKSE